MSDTGPVKATIINAESGGPRIDCMFNPKEYALTKQNNWQSGKAKGANVPPLDFGGGDSGKLQMQLFFDTYAASQDGHPKDVRKEYTDKLWNLMLVDPSLKNHKNKKARPPMVRFQWGAAWSFDAVITGINLKFTLFDSSGTPVRATADVTFTQVLDPKAFTKTNPTSGGVGGERVWTVGEGDTLTWIAYKEYGDPNRWRVIADANGLTNVRRLTPGTYLEIPNA
jgi:Contractile injection system tube protein